MYFFKIWGGIVVDIKIILGKGIFFIVSFLVNLKEIIFFILCLKIVNGIFKYGFIVYIIELYNLFILFMGCLLILFFFFGSWIG